MTARPAAPWLITATAIAAVITGTVWPWPALIALTAGTALAITLRRRGRAQTDPHADQDGCAGCVGCGGPDCVQRADTQAAVDTTPERTAS